MIKLASHASLLSLVIAATTALIGCGGAEESVDETSLLLATDSVTAVSSNDQATDSLTDATFEAVPSIDPAAAADAVAVAPPEAVDGNCRSRAKDPNDPNTIIITLNDCRGRFGKRSVSGKELVHFTKGTGMLHADFESQGLTIDNRPATHTASADITVDGMTRRIEWAGGFDTESPTGEAISHTSDLTIDVDRAAGCRTRNGSAQTTIGGRQMSSQFNNLRVCRGAGDVRSCPTGSASHTRGDRTITVEFDGTSTAVVTLPNGNTINKQLDCGS